MTSEKLNYTNTFLNEIKGSGRKKGANIFCIFFSLCAF